HAFQAGEHELAGFVLHGADLQFRWIFQCVNQLDVANAALGAGNMLGNARILKCAGAGRPLGLGALTDFFLPLRAYLAEVIGKDVTRATGVRTVPDGDGQIGQVDALVDLGQGRVVPLRDFAEVDIGEDLSGKLERLVKVEVVKRDDTT